MSNTREIATQILTDIYSKFEFFETAVGLNKDYHRLDSRDKAFIKLIIFNTLRRNGQIQRVINNLVKKPLKRKDLFIHNLLRISICQILFLDIKEYSIVNTAVEISKVYKKEKFVNGLLRNVCRNKFDIRKSIINEPNIPNWIRNDLLSFSGKKTLMNIAETVLKEPFLDIKIKRDHCKKKDWVKILKGKFISHDVIRVKNEGPIEKKPYFNKGIWWIQSISSTLPVRFIESIFNETKSSEVSILDVGAAPGGKTFQLLEKGFKVTSLEISDRRIRRLKENLNRLNYNTKIISGDFLSFRSNELFDCILLDAPCTASGLIQKKPEILIKDKSQSLKKLIQKQKKMLHKSVGLIKQGGYILYCVCSIHSNEGIKIIENFLKKNKNFELIELDKKISTLGKTLKKGMLLITPDDRKIQGGLDGFFIAVIRKIKSYD